MPRGALQRYVCQLRARAHAAAAAPERCTAAAGYVAAWSPGKDAHARRGAAAAAHCRLEVSRRQRYACQTRAGATARARALCHARQVLWRAVERAIPDVRQRALFDVIGSPLAHEAFLRRDRGTYGMAWAAGSAAPYAGMLRCALHVAARAFRARATSLAGWRARARDALPRDARERQAITGRAMFGRATLHGAARARSARALSCATRAHDPRRPPALFAYARSPYHAHKRAGTFCPSPSPT